MINSTKKHSIFLIILTVLQDNSHVNADDSRYSRFVAQSYGKNLSDFALERGIKEFDKNFQKFILDFDKHYNTNIENDYRASKFLYNLEFIQKQNSYYERRRIPFRLRINQFADQDMNENTVRKQKTFVTSTSQLSSDNVLQDDNTYFQNELHKTLPIANGQFDQIPKEFDWRTKNILTPIKNQGNCGSCWALASISIVESVNALANNSLRIASSEQLMDCVRPPAFQSRGCDGGSPLEAFYFVKSFGVASSLKYSNSESFSRFGDGLRDALFSSSSSFSKSSSSTSASSLGTCHDVTLPGDKLWIDFYRVEKRLSDQKIMELIYRNGPIAALINAGDEDFTFYGEGVITSPGDTRFDTPYNHLVNIVGWSNDNGLDYWIIRNSWSQKWGENGYARMLRGINNRGINNFIVYAGATMRNIPSSSSTESPSNNNDFIPPPQNFRPSSSELSFVQSFISICLGFIFVYFL